MYDNPENIGPDEIIRKLKCNLKPTENRKKRFLTLLNYSINKITKEEWINKFCKNNLVG